MEGGSGEQVEDELEIVTKCRAHTSAKAANIAELLLLIEQT